MDYETLKVAIGADRVGIVTMSRPEVRNAMNTQMMDELRDCFAASTSMPIAAACLILTGDGGGLLRRRRPQGAQGHDGRRLARQHAIVEQMMRALMDCPIPVIAAVNGAAYAGGMEIALGCDFIYAAQSARFALTEVTLGIMPGGAGTQNLPRAVGVRRAKELILTGTPFTAEEAQEWGMVNKVCPDDRADGRGAAPSAQRIAANAPISVRQAKKALDKATELDRRPAMPSRSRPTTARSAPKTGTRASRLQREAQAGLQRALKKKESPWKDRSSGPRRDGEARRRFPELGRDSRRVRRVCERFPNEYWLKLDHEAAYPTEFVNALTEAGYLGALIPEEYGGAGLPLRPPAPSSRRSTSRAATPPPAMRRCTPWARCCGTAARRRRRSTCRTSPPASCACRRSASPSRPPAPIPPSSRRAPTRRATTATSSTARRCGRRRALHSDLMLLLARTTPPDQVKKRSDGLSVFLVDLREAKGKGMEIRPIDAMINHNTSEVFFDDLEVPAENLIGDEGQGFRYILDSMNAERILIGSEASATRAASFAAPATTPRSAWCSAGRSARTRACSSRSRGRMPRRTPPS